MITTDVLDQLLAALADTRAGIAELAGMTPAAHRAADQLLDRLELQIRDH